MPEVWTCGADRFTVLLRQADGVYAEAERSPTFGLFSPVEMLAFVRTGLAMDDQTAFTVLFREKVREALLR